MSSALLLVGLLVVSQTADIFLTGGPVEDTAHPLASAAYPSLFTDGVRGGATGSVGGALNNGGAWASTPAVGMSIGLQPPPFLGDYATQSLLQGTGRWLQLTPKNPLAAWGSVSLGRWSFGASGQYGKYAETSKLADEEFDRTESESGAGGLGVGRAIGAWRGDLAVSYHRLRVADRKGSVVGSPDTWTFRYPAIGKASVRVAGPAWRGTLVTRAGISGGDGELNGDAAPFVGYEASAAWVREMTPEPFEVTLGATVSGFEGPLTLHDVSLRQSAVVNSWRPHALVFTAVESLRLKPEGAVFARTFRVGYQYSISYFRFTAAADVEAFPSVIVLGAEVLL